MRSGDEEREPIGVFLFAVALFVLACAIWGCSSAMRKPPQRLEDFCARQVNHELAACRALRRRGD